MGAPQIRRDRPARAEDERPDRLHAADSTTSQSLNHDDEDLLDKVLRSGCVAKVPEAIESYPRRETAIELRLLCMRFPWRGGRNCVGEHCISGGGQVRVRHTTDRTKRLTPASRLTACPRCVPSCPLRLAAPPRRLPRTMNHALRRVLSAAGSRDPPAGHASPV